MTDLDLEAIKARARAATPGPWVVDDAFIISESRKSFTERPEDVVWPDDQYAFNPQDGAHIAGMDPETTLALIGRIKRLEAAWVDAATSGEWAAFQLEELRDALRAALKEDQ